MLRYALTIPLSAFLLFQVQPLVAKAILPWFGGSPAVWTTCMLFFQALLLGGYFYAHVLSERPRDSQMGIHLAVLALALLFLPIAPDPAWKPTGNEAPAGRILLLLAATIGVPYLCLSATGPLLQRWFSQTHPDRSPYRLYSLSNVGSLAALLTYPFLFEPRQTLQQQTWGWSGLFVLFVVLCAWTAIRFRSSLNARSAAEVEASTAADREAAAAPLSWQRLALWLGLSLFPSLLLLATTNQMCQEVAVVPFLWVLPLSLYLLSFIICFENERWYHRAVFGPLLVVATTAAVLCLHQGVSVVLPLQVVAYSLALFAACMACHGELARSKPPPRQLTLFYLVVSLGGALGGLLAVVVAPAVFLEYWEFHFGLVGCVALTLITWLTDRESPLHFNRHSWLWIPLGCGFSGLIVALYHEATHGNTTAIERTRNFYGVLTVRRIEDSSEDGFGPYRTLSHGRIQHGFQYLSDEQRMTPTSYYSPDSGVGLAIRHHPRRELSTEADPFRVGVIGLGTGTLAAYGRPGDQIHFYEINAEVRRIANQHFRYLSETPADVEVVLGDARVQLERELEAGSQRFDVLAIDAFSSDAIPMHLLTRECYGLYWQHLRADGILAIHISNRYLDLQPVVQGLVQEAGHQAALISWDNPDDDPRFNSSSWILCAREMDFDHQPGIDFHVDAWTTPRPPLVWSDDYGSLWQVVRTTDWKSAVRDFLGLD